MAFSRDPGLAIIFVVVIPVLGTIIFHIVRQGLPLFSTLQVKLDTLNLVLREGLTGIRVIRAFHRESEEKKRFETTNLDYSTTSIAVNRLMGSMMPLVTLVMNLAIISIVWFGGIRVIALLMRFYEIQDGSITIDGVDIRDLKRGTLRSNFGMVLQDTRLFKGTIRENIAYGRVVETGTHHDLLSMGGFYAELYNSQFSTEGNYPQAG